MASNFYSVDRDNSAGEDDRIFTPERVRWFVAGLIIAGLLFFVLSRVL